MSDDVSWSRVSHPSRGDRPGAGWPLSEPLVHAMIVADLGPAIASTTHGSTTTADNCALQRPHISTLSRHGYKTPWMIQHSSQRSLVSGMKYNLSRNLVLTEYRSAHEFPSHFPTMVKQMYRQLLRIFAHVFYAHYPVLLHLHSEGKERFLRNPIRNVSNAFLLLQVTSTLSSPTSWRLAKNLRSSTRGI